MKYIKSQESQIIKYLRFRNKEPNECQYTYMSLGPIAKLLNRSVSYV